MAQLRVLPSRADDAKAPELLVRLPEDPNRFADNTRRERVVKRDRRSRHMGGDNDMDPGIAKDVSRALPGSQVEHGAVNIGDGPFSFREEALQIFDRGFLNLRCEVVLP